MPLRGRPMTSRRTLELALGLTLLSGLLQNAARLFGRVVLGQPLDHGVYAWWMTPLGDALLIVPLALVLLLLGTRFNWARSAAVRASVLVFPVVLTLLLLVPRLHLAAQILLAAGVAVRLGVWAPNVDMDRFVPRVTGALLVLTLVVAVPASVWPAVREARDSRALASPRAGAPNVLLLIWDTARAASMDLYGHGAETTPFLTRLAANGVVFERAFATASYTLPSHASLLTGRWAHELSSDWRVPLNSEPATLAEVLRSAGYRTGGFSANRHYVTREYGLGRGFMHFDEHRLGFQQAVRSSTLGRMIATSRVVRDLLSFDDDLARVHAADHHRALLGWIKRDPRRPYFAFVNFMEAHTPYLPQPPFAQRFGWYREGATRAERRQVQVIGRNEPEQLPREAALHSQRAYEASIAQLDDAVARILDDLRSQGLLENTVVIITADHGEEFGEHGIFGHGNSLYVASTQVPLVMVHPGLIPPARRVSQAVSIRDVPATILDLAGLGTPLPGESLRPLWESPGSRKEYPVLSELRYDPRLPESSLASRGDMASAADEAMQVIRNGGQDYEVFDLATDRMGVARGDTLDERFRRLRSSLPPVRAGAVARNPRDVNRLARR